MLRFSRAVIKEFNENGRISEEFKEDRTNIWRDGFMSMGEYEFYMPKSCICFQVDSRSLSRKPVNIDFLNKSNTQQYVDEYVHYLLTFESAKYCILESDIEKVFFLTEEEFLIALEHLGIEYTIENKRFRNYTVPR